ncbi:MAG: hypothetical protein ACKOOI_20425, partial [Pirellula sp.]
MELALLNITIERFKHPLTSIAECDLLEFYGQGFTKITVFAAATKSSKPHPPWSSNPPNTYRV